MRPAASTPVGPAEGKKITVTSDSHDEDISFRRELSSAALAELFPHPIRFLFQKEYNSLARPHK